MRCKICNSNLKIKYRDMFDNRHGYPGRFKIYKCVNCGFMQTRPELSFRKLTAVYTNHYPKRDINTKGIVLNSKNIPSKKFIHKNGLSTDCHLQTKKGQKVLDIGCGTCQSLLEIKELGGEAWGIDPDKNSENVSKQLGLNFHRGTIHSCTFPKKYFDIITASQVLEHEGLPIKLLKDCKKFIKPSGKILLSFPNTNSLYRRIWGRKWLHWHVPYHINHFNKDSFVLTIQKTGFKVESMKTTTPNLWTILQIRSLINSPKIGQRDTMWDGKSESDTQSGNKTISHAIFDGLIPLVNKFLFINRMIDRFGFGESFVVTLTPII